MPNALGVYILDKGVKGTFILHGVDFNYHIQVMPGAEATIQYAKPTNNIHMKYEMWGGGNIEFGYGVSLKDINNPCPPDHELAGLPFNFMTKNNFVEHLYK